MNKVNYDRKPASIEAVGNGSYLYRWSIEEIMTDEVAQWLCYEVTVWNLSTDNAITERVIDTLWGDGIEQKLLNDYQAAQLGVLDENFAAPYLDFLAERKVLKEQIAEDYQTWKSAM